jgi:hypothetical protein
MRFTAITPKLTLALMVTAAVRFTNGLTVYLTGDTGLYGEMRVNISDTPTLGPDEGAFAMRMKRFA